MDIGNLLKYLLYYNVQFLFFFPSVNNISTKNLAPVEKQHSTILMH